MTTKQKDPESKGKASRTASRRTSPKSGGKTVKKTAKDTKRKTKPKVSGESVVGKELDSTGEATATPVEQTRDTGKTSKKKSATKSEDRKSSRKSSAKKRTDTKASGEQKTLSRKTSTRKASSKSDSRTPKRRQRKVKPDSVLARAVEQARAIVADVVPNEYIGEHIEVVAEAERLLTHYFACLHPGYAGWAWAVTMTRVPRSKTPTICEVELLPHEGALLAPEWLPWEERMNPSDGSNDDDDDYDASEDGRLTPDRRKGDHKDERRFDVDLDRGESPWEIDALRVNDLTLEVLDPQYFWATDDSDDTEKSDSRAN